MSIRSNEWRHLLYWEEPVGGTGKSTALRNVPWNTMGRNIKIRGYIRCQGWHELIFSKDSDPREKRFRGWSATTSLTTCSSNFELGASSVSTSQWSSCACLRSAEGAFAENRCFVEMNCSRCIDEPLKNHTFDVHYSPPRSVEYECRPVEVCFIPIQLIQGWHRAAAATAARDQTLQGYKQWVSYPGLERLAIIRYVVLICVIRKNWRWAWIISFQNFGLIWTSGMRSDGQRWQAFSQRQNRNFGVWPLHQMFSLSHPW